jgi:trk system potassium uptake protein
VLLSENLEDMDGFVAITGIDEENLLSSLLAKQNGVKKVITKISRTNYMDVVRNLGIDNIISPKSIIAGKILKYVRGNKIESLYRIIEGQAEIIEFIANESSKMLDIPIKQLGLLDNVIIATIVRKNEIVIPNGNDVIRQGDRVIVITKNENITGLDDLSANSVGGIQNELRNGIKKLGGIINL